MMDWSKIEESSKELPENIVESLLEGFSAATKDLVQIKVIQSSDFSSSTSKLKNRFQFRVHLVSKYLSDYAFRILEFGYNVDLYPIYAIISASILEELIKKGETYSATTVFDDGEKFKAGLELIFNSKRFTEVVSGLMKIAKKQADLADLF